MLHRYSDTFRTLLLLTDLLLVSVSWIAAYWVRFYTVFDAPLGVPDFHAYVPPLAVILPLWFVLFRARRLYEPLRTGTIAGESGAVIRATAEGVLLLVAVTFFARSYFFSRGVVLLYAVFAAGSVVAFRAAGRLALRAARRRGKNLRYVLVVGAGRLAEEVTRRVHAHPEAGLRVRGVLSCRAAPGRQVGGTPVIGDYGDLKQVLRGERIDQVILALPHEDRHHLEKVLAALDDEMVTVRLVPDLLHVLTLRASVENLDGLAMINLRETPLVGFRAVAKRLLDVAVSGAALVLSAPLLAGIALASSVSAGRPILYRQRRMGLDGRVFEMFKFRTMVSDAEAATGPVWARPGDPRCTPVGALLRRTSLDELPQLWNVLRGDMSLVGPRPERPVFIEQFRREIPGYMLRHKVRAGLTGWAQVRGWRGNTSLHERIEHDIYYIQNWSLALDVRILWLTLWRAFRDRNAC